MAGHRRRRAPRSAWPRGAQGALQPQRLFHRRKRLGAVVKAYDVRAAAESAGDTTYIIGKIDDGEGVVRYDNSGHLFDEKDWSAR